MPDKPPAPDPNAKQPDLQPASLDFGFAASINPLACYRVCTVAVGLPELNRLLAEGWELIHPDFCEQMLRAGQGPSQQRAQFVYEVYALVGKRDTLMATDQRAMEEGVLRRAMAAGEPVEGEGQDDPAAPAQGGEQAEAEEGGGRAKVGVPHKTASASRHGFEPTGGLRP